LHRNESHSAYGGASVSGEVAAVSADGYRRVAIAASIGTFIEVYDLALYGLFSAFLADAFFPQADPGAALLSTFAIFAVAFVVRPVGGILWGHLGDRIGRRPALVLSLQLMTVATVAFGLLPTYASVGLLAPALLLLCRVLQGLSVSAELPGAQLLILEHTPRHRRGRVAGMVVGAASLGTAAAMVVALVLSRVLTADQLSDWGWRVAFLIAAVIGVVGFYLRSRVVDSPAFTALGERAKAGPPPVVRAVQVAKRGMVAVTILLAVSYACGYVLAGYLPAYLIRTAGLSPSDAFTAGIVMIVYGVVMGLGWGYAIDRFPVRRVAVVAMVGAAVTVVPGFFIIIEGATLPTVIAGQAIVVTFISGSLPVAAFLCVAIFPTAIRFTTTAIVLNVAAAVFGGTAPYVCTWLVRVTGDPVSPGFYLLLIALAGLAAAVFGLVGQRTDEDSATAETSPDPVEALSSRRPEGG
jgi:MHS family proline/betaine transporter-like MFS transporter